jgi:hypothetical protein
METSEPVVLHHGRQAGRCRSPRGAAVCFNGLLGGARHKRREVCARVLGGSVSTGEMGKAPCSFSNGARLIQIIV